MSRNANDQITVSIDLGADTTKAACAYRLYDENYEQELLLNKGEGIPSLAYYDAEQAKWVFGREEIAGYAAKSFQYLVRIRDLLNLFFTRERDGLYDGLRFKNYHYPPRTDDSYEEAIAKGDYFESRVSPRCVLELFVKYVMDRVKEEIGRIFGDLPIRYVVVYPANAEKDYIDELVRLVSRNKADRDSVYIVSSARAVGVAAKEYDIVNARQKNVLIFNIGEEDISVVKVRFDKENIYAYGADGRNSPERIGGRNIDIAIAEYIDNCSAGIPAFGSKGSVQSVEQGVYFDQYRMQQAIKLGKMVYPKWLANNPGKGYPFPLYREMIMDVPVDREVFRSCCREVYEKIWAYVEKELQRSDNVKDVDAVLFSGGAADTYGLDEYVQEKLASSYPDIAFIDFSPDNNNALCAAKNTVPIGAALFGAGKYSFKVLTALSYGTWAQLDPENSDIELNYRYVELLRKGEVIALQGKPDFKQQKWANIEYTGGPKKQNGIWQIHNEYYSCDTGEVYRVSLKNAKETDFRLFFCSYQPNTMKKNKPFKGNAYVNYHRYSDGSGHVTGSTYDKRVVLTLNRVGYDYYINYKLPSYVPYDEAFIAGAVCMKEGFLFDYEGRPTPIVKNVSSEYYNKRSEKYDELMAELKKVEIENKGWFNKPAKSAFLRLLDSVELEVVSSGRDIKF